MAKIVISAVNFTEGGPLSVLIDCLNALQENNYGQNEIIVYVHSKSLVKQYLSYFEFHEYPLIKSSWLKRLHFEFIQSKKLSKILQPDYWISLHDITPNVICKKQFVYCHNPSPFYKVSLKEATLDFKFALFNIFYKYLYEINIKRNKYVIVQQTWLRNEFKKRYNVESIVAYPHIASSNIIVNKVPAEKALFFYPSFPRIFKNFEVLCEAAKILSSKRDDFEVVITINGSENAYSKMLLSKYHDCGNIKFVGKISRSQVYEYYEKASCLLFPSKLETWGMPLTEFKNFKKPILAADLPYAKETIGNYNQVTFFDPYDAKKLASEIDLLIDGKLNFEGNQINIPDKPFAANWNELFEIILER